MWIGSLSMPSKHSQLDFEHPERGLVLHRISKRFGTVQAVDGVSMTVQPKEFVAVIGPTGCGKTTLLRLIAGFEAPTSGQIFIHGRCVTEVKPQDRGVRMVFQNNALWSHMQVYSEKKASNLSFGMRIQKQLSQKIQQSVNIISRRLGIGKELFPRTPNQLSGGQKQLVGIGRAMTIMPTILLLDEPMAHVDPRKRLDLRRELKQYHRSMDIITLCVTHILPDAFALADRVAVMNEGKIIQVDSPRKLRENPADSFIKDFVESFEL